jgi:hypothetical protein
MFQASMYRLTMVVNSENVKTSLPSLRMPDTVWNQWLQTPDSSHQNGPGEHPHQTIGDAIHAMLGGTSLPPKFWPYAFHHFLHLYNVTIHGDKEASPFKICSGIKPNLCYLCVLGCQVYALSCRPHHPNKALSDACIGIFLGFAKTMKNVLYFNVAMETIKMAQHVAFDESMNDLEDKLPNARLLDGLCHDKLDLVDVEFLLLDLDVSPQPFTSLTTVTVHLDLDSPNPLGFEFDDCSRLCHAFVSTIHCVPVGCKAHFFCQGFMGSYIVSINDTPIFDSADIEQVLNGLRTLASPPATIELELAPELKSDHHGRSSPLHLCMHDLHHITALQSIAEECSMHTSLRQVHVRMYE